MNGKGMYSEKSIKQVQQKSPLLSKCPKRQKQKEEKQSFLEKSKSLNHHHV
jgi:predicted outer membrane protein